MSRSRALPVAIVSLTIACTSSESPDESGAPTPSAETGAPLDTGAPTDTDVAPGPLDVLIATSTGGPFVGVPVVFHNPDGTVFGTTTSGDSGQASVDGFPPGGAVTVAVPGEQTVLITMLDLVPGTLTVDPTEGAFDQGAPAGSVEVTVPAAVAGLNRYTVETTCGGNAVSPGMSTSIDLFRECLDDSGRTAVFALADNDDDGAIAFAYEPDVFVNGRAPSQVVFDEWRTDWSRFDLVASNRPTTVEAVSVSHWEQRQDSILYRGRRQEVAAAPGPVTVGLDRVVGLLDSVVTRVEATNQAAVGASNSTYWRGSEAVPTVLALDLSAELPPRLHEVAFDETAREVSWTLDGSFAEADTMRVLLSWKSGVFWIVDGPPPSDSRVRLPQLPDSQSLGLDAQPNFVTAELFGTSRFDGWPALRGAYRSSESLVFPAGAFEAWRSRG